MYLVKKQILLSLHKQMGIFSIIYSFCAVRTCIREREMQKQVNIKNMEMLFSGDRVKRNFKILTLLKSVTTDM